MNGGNVGGCQTCRESAVRFVLWNNLQTWNSTLSKENPILPKNQSILQFIKTILLCRFFWKLEKPVLLAGNLVVTQDNNCDGNEHKKVQMLKQARNFCTDRKDDSDGKWQDIGVRK